MKIASIFSKRAFLVAALCFAAGAVAGCADAGGDVNRTAADPAAIARLPGDRLIVPGHRVGPIALWMTLDDAEAILGPPGFTGTHQTCWQTCYNFNKYGWPQYGLTVFTDQYDPRAKISQITIWSGTANGAGQWQTASGVSFATPFKEALNRINESIDIRYQSRCDSGGCAGYDADGMWIRADNRDAPLTDLVIYDPDWSMSGGHNQMGNVPPRNANAMTKMP